MVEGVIVYKDQKRYEGQIKETKKRHGKGKMYDEKGHVTFEGSYRDDLPLEKFVYYGKPEQRNSLK